MMLKEILQKKFEYAVSHITNDFIYYWKDEHTIRKECLRNFQVINEYRSESSYTCNWADDFLLVSFSEEEKINIYSLPDFKRIFDTDYSDEIYRLFNYEDYLLSVGERYFYRYDKKNRSFSKLENCVGYVDICFRKDNLIVCKNYHKIFILEMKNDMINVVLHIAIDEIFKVNEIQKVYPEYDSEDLYLYKVMPYENDLIIVSEVGISKMTMGGEVVWTVIYSASESILIIGKYAYEGFRDKFYRINLETGELDLYGNDGSLPNLKYNDCILSFFGGGIVYHNGYIWRMLFANGFTFLAAIDPETGQYKYFHRFYDGVFDISEPLFVDDKIYIYDHITKTLHVLEEVEGEPEKTFCGVPMSETELEKVDITKKVNNKKPAPTYEDADIPLFEEIKQVAHIEHACVLDAECIDSLEDYSSLIVDILSLADVRKFTIVEHTLSGSISLKKGRKVVEFTPNGSDYIDTYALLKALNEFLPICGAKGRIFSLWTPDMLQTEMFFYTEDTEAVENYSAENLQTDEAVDFEDMKGEIKW